MTPEQRAAVAVEALTWVRTPYHPRARLKGVGVDCAHILCSVYETAGVLPHIDPGEYRADWHVHRREERYVAWMERYCDRVDEADAQIGDAVLFKFENTYSHSAIIVAPGRVVHAYIGRGVIESLIDEEPLEGVPRIYWTPKNGRL